MIYEENLKIILQEIDQATNKQRQLRHAYSDLVATFEYFGNQYGERLGLPNNTNYQNLKNARKAFKKYGIDIYSELSDIEKINIKQVFQKRHAFQHHRGKVTLEYIREFPQKNLTKGENLELIEEEFKSAVKVLSKIINRIIKTA